MTILVMLDAIMWSWIFADVRGLSRDEYLFAALDVGQGDATVIRTPSGATFMTDAGPDGSVIRALDRLLPASTRGIDVVTITHAQLDHYGGLVDVLRSYRIGMILWNGRTPDTPSPAWNALQEEIATRAIPLVAVGAGDHVRHGGMKIAILSPDDAWRETGEPNDAGIVQGVVTPAWTALLTADIGGTLEEDLGTQFVLSADILKVGHHGSKHSTSPTFLAAIQPSIATVSLGARNRYGHPASSTIEQLTGFVGERLFRTDRDGTIRITGKAGAPLKVSLEHFRRQEDGEP